MAIIPINKKDVIDPTRIHRGYYATDMCCLDDYGNARSNENTNEPWGSVPSDLVPAQFLRYAFSFTQEPKHSNADGRTSSIEYYKQRDPEGDDV